MLPLELLVGLLGLVGAFTSALLGIGGAIIMLPLLLYTPPLFGPNSAGFSISRRKTKRSC